MTIDAVKTEARLCREMDCTSEANARPRCVFQSLQGGYVDYAEALRLQRAAHAARLAGAIPDTVLLLEHSPVITIGRGARGGENLISSAGDLAERGIALVETDRGGDITYHAPGQLVGYPILDLNRYGRDLHRYLRELELTLIDLLAGLGVAAGTIAGLTGVWVGNRKIAAIGIKVGRWVTMHGFALNVDLDIEPMRRDIVPCGIVDKDVTSLKELGISITRNEVEDRFVASFSQRFGVAWEYRRTSLVQQSLLLECPDSQ